MGEPQKDNDLFYICSLIEYISRTTYNTKKQIIENLGKENIEKIYQLAEVYHSENIEKIANELIEKCKLKNGNYDFFEKCNSKIPSYWDIGRVYQRLIILCSKDESEYIDNLIEILSSWIVEKIDNYNSSMYYENSSYIYECYKAGKIL